MERAVYERAREREREGERKNERREGGRGVYKRLPRDHFDLKKHELQKDRKREREIVPTADKKC